MTKKLPQVALIGRTNVGKSTLFNTLLEKRKAITSPMPATTRDRNFGICEWKARKINLVDSGGVNTIKGDEIEESILEQAKIAVNEADCIIFVVDGLQSITKQDREIAKWLKKSKVPIILAVNKIDNPKRRAETGSEYYKLGIKETINVSAINGSGTGDLLDAITEKVPEKSTEYKEPDLRLAIVGKTNVGKSSYVNALLGESRVIVSAKPHTTRDPQDIEIQYNKKRIVLVDTAGLRRKKPRKGQTETKSIENESARKSLLAIKHADIVLLMLDITEEISFQDKHIASEVIEAKTGIVVVLNKWDLIKNKSDKTLKEYLLYVHTYFPFLLWAPYVFISAKDKIRLKNPIDFALKMKENREKEIDPEKLMEFIKEFTLQINSKQRKDTKPFKMTSLIQEDINPPTFLLRVNTKVPLPKAVTNTLKKALRERFDIWGTPIIMKIKLKNHETNRRARKPRKKV
ncbi:ribosome biogenesis GTPase Der [Patescibacteria group bacterium]|nr:ribosome biogenesis GTPase Der [Patescibacteria group bacterium]